MNTKKLIRELKQGREKQERIATNAEKTLQELSKNRKRLTDLIEEYEDELHQVEEAMRDNLAKKRVAFSEIEIIKGKEEMINLFANKVVNEE